MKIKVFPAAKIKNIIFDLGGVLLNIDYSLTSKAFKELGIENFDALYSQAKQTTLFDDFEKGLTDSKQFREGLRKYINTNDDNINKAWNAMLLDFPKERLELLKKLKNNYRLFLLSNTNDIHITWYSNYLLKVYGSKDLSHIFEKDYYSYKTGMRKPEKEIFELVMKENKLNPEETLFIDDSSQHIEGAKKVNIHAYLLKAPETIIDLFED